MKAAKVPTAAGAPTVFRSTNRAARKASFRSTQRPTATLMGTLP